MPVLVSHAAVFSATPLPQTPYQPEVVSQWYLKTPTIHFCIVAVPLSLQTPYQPHTILERYPTDCPISTPILPRWSTSAPVTSSVHHSRHSNAYANRPRDRTTAYAKTRSIIKIRPIFSDESGTESVSSTFLASGTAELGLSGQLMTSDNVFCGICRFVTLSLCRLSLEL